jgi:acetoin utilization protein AcuB
VLVLDEPGQLAKLTGAIAEKGGNIIAFTQFKGKDPSNRQVTLKVTGLTEEQVNNEIEPMVKSILDIRSTR